ncbi:hypothetical protein COO60DRAFT_1482689 [Scenedesmus sp. NREL 46B-D3]|nr:hypothetical protein COO60DRAFT_1482689 [Scenedesmus sp. NREL 46B-D3]
MNPCTTLLHAVVVSCWLSWPQLLLLVRATSPYTSPPSQQQLQIRLLPLQAMGGALPLMLAAVRCRPSCQLPTVSRAVAIATQTSPQQTHPCILSLRYAASRMHGAHHLPAIGVSCGTPLPQPLHESSPSPPSPRGTNTAAAL